MFTGLIKELGDVISYQNNFLTIRAKYKPDIGDSICVNGACLTVTSINNDNFTVELTNESKKTITNNFKAKVHIEPAMKLGSRVEGHLVQGHIDFIGTIVAIQTDDNGTNFKIKVPKEAIKFIAPKGSICIDGVSLTVGEVANDMFSLTIIPHTMKNTIFNSYKLQHEVNIETDMIARYLYQIGKKNDTSWSDIDRMIAVY